jgi:AraC-like DNA-binding protein
MHLIDAAHHHSLALQRYLPPASLGAHVDNFQHILTRDAGSLPRILPGNGALILIPCSPAISLTNLHQGSQQALTGPVILCNRHQVLDLAASGASQLFVVSFRPGRLRHFGKACFADLQDRVTPTHALWGNTGSQLAEQLAAAPDHTQAITLLGDFLLKRLQHTRSADFDRLMDLLYLGPDRRISDLADTAGLSLRQFERRFTGTYGVTPKFFARVARLQRVARKLALDPASNPALSALDAGFFDHAHFVHELRKLADLSPTELTRGMRERPHFYNPLSLQRYTAQLNQA